MWFLSICHFILFLYTHNFAQGDINHFDIDVSKTFVWGPGLNPEKIVLRARYIFLQLVNKEGKNITESPGKEVVSSEIIGETEYTTPCWIQSQIFDCKDGSFIVRYKVHNTCFNLSITLKVKNQLIPLKSYRFNGPVYEEECDCPNPSIESWLTSNDCFNSYNKVLQELKFFPSINFDNLRNKIIKRYNKPNSVSICHYLVKSNHIYRKCYGNHVGFNMFVDAILLSLTRKVILPDVEFFMNLGDWPLVPKNKEILPIFSWCGSEDSNDIILPTYDLTQSSIEAMGRIILDMISVQGSTTLPWNKKIPKVFWRGRDSQRQRLDLIDIARANPSLFNASITNFFFFRNETEKYGPDRQKHVSFFDFFQYKYQLNIDGVVAAYRFPYLLAGDSLVFKQHSKYHEFFYKDVVAGQHFIPVKNDLSDLVDKINWALNNDDEVFKISQNARKFARNNLMPQNIFCYHVTLIKEWSTRIKNTIHIFPDMEQVLQPENSCKCTTSMKGKKDEL